MKPSQPQYTSAGIHGLMCFVANSCPAPREARAPLLCQHAVKLRWSCLTMLEPRVALFAGQTVLCARRYATAARPPVSACRISTRCCRLNATCGRRRKRLPDRLSLPAQLVSVIYTAGCSQSRHYPLGYFLCRSRAYKSRLRPFIKPETTTRAQVHLAMLGHQVSWIATAACHPSNL